MIFLVKTKKNGFGVRQWCVVFSGPILAISILVPTPRMPYFPARFLSMISISELSTFTISQKKLKFNSHYFYFLTISLLSFFPCQFPVDRIVTTLCIKGSRLTPWGPVLQSLIRNFPIFFSFFSQNNEFRFFSHKVHYFEKINLKKWIFRFFSHLKTKYFPVHSSQFWAGNLKFIFI